jgi:hypothetical protein
MPISLKTAIQSSYGNKKAKQKNLNERYVKDKNLSNANQKVFYNPDTGNLLFNVAGSRAAKDFLYNDPMLALGLLKKTDRYKDAKKTLEQAKNIYQHPIHLMQALDQGLLLKLIQFLVLMLEFKKLQNSTGTISAISYRKPSTPLANQYSAIARNFFQELGTSLSFQKSKCS